jgi:CRP-like cAMP-binding protein
MTPFVVDSGGRLAPAAVVRHFPRMQDVLELCRGIEKTTFEAGDVLIPEGGKTGILYVLVSGCLEVVKGEDPVTRIRQPGAFVGEISLLLDGPHTASVVARETTVCHAIRDGKAFLLAHPEVCLAVAELLAARMKGLIGYLADMRVQFSDRKDHLGMVDELLLDLAHRVPRR